MFLFPLPLCHRLYIFSRLRRYAYPADRTKAGPSHSRDSFSLRAVVLRNNSTCLRRYLSGSYNEDHEEQRGFFIFFLSRSQLRGMVSLSGIKIITPRVQKVVEIRSNLEEEWRILSSVRNITGKYSWSIKKEKHKELISLSIVVHGVN